MALNDRLLSVIRGLGWGLVLPAKRLAGSLSGAGVFRMRTAAGDDVVVKVTLSGPIRHLAQRELDFYRVLSGRVPVLTPRLLRHVSTDDFIALMLSAHTPMPPAREWSDDAWLDTARQLAMLHATVVLDRDPWNMASWLDNSMSQPPNDQVTTYWSASTAADAFTGMLRDIDRLDKTRARPQPCLTHGDCHADNFLVSGDRLVWSDWQAVAVANPADDLAFLWSRAVADGADPPCAAMLAAYLDTRGADAGERTTFTQAVLAAEIGILLFGWPMYAGHHRQEEQDRVTRRFIERTNTWRNVDNGTTCDQSSCPPR